MGFNSYEFLVFLPLVFFIYWGVLSRWRRGQNLFIVIASYTFYGYWDWRFLFLLFVSSLADFFIGRALHGTERLSRRKAWLGASLLVNLGMLGYFKYYNFFVKSFVLAFAKLGVDLNPSTLEIILPVGISFYTFQTLSYTLDIYYRRLEPTRDAVAFFAFVSFFPQLVAGPIERARKLLPQFHVSRKFDYAQAVDGGRQILWGMFKKIVVADNLAIGSDYMFEHYAEVGGGYLLVGVVFFAFQIYCDFSGYSDIAIGVARWFGFELSKNFGTPYFSRTFQEGWSRWHISLTNWFRDYVYAPLGGGKKGKARQVLNLVITMGLSGLWHGANWTYVIWGLMHGLLMVPGLLWGTSRYRPQLAKGALFPNLKELRGTLILFSGILVPFIFFRSPSVADAWGYLQGLVRWEGYWVKPEALEGQLYYSWLGVLLFMDWIHRNRRHQLEISYLPRVVRWLIYVGLLLLVLNYWGESKTFIYFQF